MVTYDVSTVTVAGAKRLRDIAKTCENVGQRVQDSVFECLLDPDDLVKLRTSLLRITDKSEDSLRFYHLGKNWHRRIERFGVKRGYDPDEPLIL